MNYTLNLPFKQPLWICSMLFFNHKHKITMGPLRVSWLVRFLANPSWCNPIFFKVRCEIWNMPSLGTPRTTHRNPSRGSGGDFCCKTAAWDLLNNFVLCGCCFVLIKVRIIIWWYIGMVIYNLLSRSFQFACFFFLQNHRCDYVRQSEKYECLFSPSSSVSCKPSPPS